MQTSRIKDCVAFTFLALVILCQSWYAQELQSNRSKQNDQPQAIEVAKGLYVLEESGCNITVSAGPDGLLVVDTGSKEDAQKNRESIIAISKDPIRFIINTHFHFDHVGGNEIFAEEGAILIAHANSRKRMSEEWKVPEIFGMKWPTVPPYPEPFLSQVCLNDSLMLHFNNDTVQAIHLPNGHSGGDVIIIFKEANVIHTGDLYLSNGFPIVDIFHGGSVNGTIAAVDQIIEMCDENTVIIPGHGHLSNREELQAYRDMLVTARDRIVRLVEQGKTLEEVREADPTAGLYKGGEKSWLAPEFYVYCVYQELTGK